MSRTNFMRTEIIRSLTALVVFCALGTQASTLPPDPNNAALLYYQAFLRQPETDYAEEQLVYNTRSEKIYDFLCGDQLEFDTDIEKEIQELENRLKNDVNEPDEMPYEMEGMEEMMPERYFGYNIQFTLSELHKRREHEQKMRGVDPNETIRNYMKKCLDAIELAQAASELTDCDWGIRYSRPDDPTGTPLVKIRRFAFMLRVDALLHAANGDYRTAFERCMMIRRFARHFGDDAHLPIVHAVATNIGRMALNDIQFLLGCHKPETETLTWLKDQLVIENDTPLSLTRILKMDFELTLQTLRNNTEMLDKAREATRLKNLIMLSSKDELTPNNEDAREVRSVTDEELVALAGKPYADFLNSALQVIASGKSYQEKYSEIQSLTEKIENEYGGDPASFPILAAHPEKMLTLSIVMRCAEPVSNLYGHHVSCTAHFNAFMVAIEVYLAKARTGQLPEKLPDSVPKDPFSGKDFEYETTEAGFLLRCRAADLGASRWEHRPAQPPKLLSEKSQQYEFKVQR